MIHENVPIEEAQEMVAAGGRILEHRRNEKDEHVCKVQTFEAETESEAGAEDAPKKRGRPPKTASKG